MNNINTGEFATELQKLKDNKAPMEDLLSLYKEYFSIYPDINIVKKYYNLVLGKTFNNSSLLKYNKLCGLPEEVPINNNPLSSFEVIDNDEDYHEDYHYDYDGDDDEEDF